MNFFQFYKIFFQNFWIDQSEKREGKFKIQKWSNFGPNQPQIGTKKSRIWLQFCHSYVQYIIFWARQANRRGCQRPYPLWFLNFNFYIIGSRMRVQKLKFFWWNEFTKFLRDSLKVPLKYIIELPIFINILGRYYIQSLRCDSHDFLCESFMQKKKIYRSIVVLPSLGPPWSILTVAFLSSSNLAL